MAHLSQEKLKEAIRQETLQVETFFGWLSQSMPARFFEEIHAEWILIIVRTLIGFEEQEYFSEIHFKNAALSLCLDSLDADVKILESYPLHGIKNYTTYLSQSPYPGTDRYLRIATLSFTEASDTIETPEKVPFLKRLPLDLQESALQLIERAYQSDHCQYETRTQENGTLQILLAWKNVPKHNFLYRLARVVFHHGLVMQRVNATYINPYNEQGIFLLSFSLLGAQDKPAQSVANIPDFLQEMVTLKYFGSLDLIEKTFVATGLIRGNLGNFLRSLLNFIHQVLVNADQNLFSLENIEESLCHHPELTLQLVKAFETKFHPTEHNIRAFEKKREEFNHLVQQLDTGHEYQDTRRKHVLLQGMNFITHLLKTNFYLPNKTALAFRLDPQYLNHAPFEREKFFPELPFGIFYIKGMHFLSFHIRFKDLSRGGLRTVYAEKEERVIAERHTVFTECYNLAYTQNKKNKDIPEGGSKAVIFLKPYARLDSEAAIYTQEMHNAVIPKEEIENRITLFKAAQKREYLYQTQRSFIRSLLSLINCEANGALREPIGVDYWQKPEYIYLGPDENMHDVMIEWIAKESSRVHYKPGSAFISGKPHLGINHKAHGVTSLGVHVFMQEALRHLNIDPSTTPFTVKMTGGPDGDVAGNELLNLYRDYPDTAKLIALTDGSGTIYDPLGIDLKICSELFHKGEAIRFYPPKKLSSGGFLLDRETRKEIGPYAQQTLLYKNQEGTLVEEWLSSNETHALLRHNVHQTKADLFIPCGGRPRTLRETNYKEFLDPQGMPTARAIIEGANLYLTPWARTCLEDRGVLVIKDSSANKCGVICSSFEVLSVLTLSEAAFLSHKALLVSEILERLQLSAHREASLLFETHRATQASLTEISDDISKKILLFRDQILSYLETITLSSDQNDSLIQTFLNYCPRTLRESFSEELMCHIPESHKKAIIASTIAANLVYKKGLSWQPTLIDILPLLL